MASRPLLVALVAVMAVVFVSWLIGELLRQRRAGRRHRRH